jgi:23S rRNA pseudouridine2457 synthase
MSKIILLNKPFNVLCQFTDREGRATLADYVDSKSVYPAGRLDYDSEGLVILTDDGRLQHQISHPTAKLTKTYWVEVEGVPSENDLEPLCAGVELADGRCRPAVVKHIDTPPLWPRTPPVRVRKHIPTSWIQLEITEGRNRQVRRMTAAVGFPTLRLVRVKVGSWGIGALKPGETELIKVHPPSTKQPRRGRTASGRRRL